jgi:hypothetical protein
MTTPQRPSHAGLTAQQRADLALVAAELRQLAAQIESPELTFNHERHKALRYVDAVRKHSGAHFGSDLAFQRTLAADGLLGLMSARVAAAAKREA